MPSITLSSVSPTGPISIQIVGGENLYRLAEFYLNDATQWWRIAYLNDFPGEQPDFIVSADDATRLGGTLLIPAVSQNVSWP